jgi:hypothetical protein
VKVLVNPKTTLVSKMKPLLKEMKPKVKNPKVKNPKVKNPMKTTSVSKMKMKNPKPKTRNNS